MTIPRGGSIQQHDPMLAARLATEMSGYHIHGALYTVSAASQSVTMTTAGTYYTADGWTGVQKETGSGYLVGNATNGTFTIGAKGAGVYRIFFRSTSYVSVAKQIITKIYVGSTAQAASEMRVHLAVTGTTRPLISSCLATLAAGEVVTVRVSNDTDGTIVYFPYASLEMYWIAGA